MEAGMAMMAPHILMLRSWGVLGCTGGLLHVVVVGMMVDNRCITFFMSAVDGANR